MAGGVWGGGGVAAEEKKSPGTEPGLMSEVVRLFVVTGR